MDLTLLHLITSLRNFTHHPLTSSVSYCHRSSAYFLLCNMRDQLSHKHKHQAKTLPNILIFKHIVFANLCCVNINLLHATPMWMNYKTLYISLHQYKCVHDTLCMCMMTEYYLATYSWGLHTEHMQGFRIALPCTVKPDSHCSFLGISISLITASM